MDLIPLPQRSQFGRTGAEPFRLTTATTLDGAPGTEAAERWLRTVLGAATGLPLASAPDPDVGLRLDAGSAPRSTGSSSTGGVRCSPPGAAGGLPGRAQTLRQLLGPDAYRRAPLRRTGWTLPACEIEDAPRFGWRGVDARRGPALHAEGRSCCATSTCWRCTSSTCCTCT